MGGTAGLLVAHKPEEFSSRSATDRVAARYSLPAGRRRRQRALEYGNLTGCLSEDRHPQTQGLFAAFKASQRLVATSLLARSATTLIWARPFFVYGPGQRPTSLVPSCYRTLCEGRKPDIKSPDVLNDFIHVDDVASGMAALATSAAPGGDFNLGSGEPARIRDVANLVARLMGLPAVFEPSAAPGVGFWADMTRMRTLTAWRPKIFLGRGRWQHSRCVEGSPMTPPMQAVIFCGGSARG